MFFGHKNRRQTELVVDLGDLENEKEHLSSFLQSKQIDVAPDKNKLIVNSEKMSAQELQRMVTKFIYRRNFNNTHWVSVEGASVKVNRFKVTAKKEKHKKKENAIHQTAVQSWGL